MWITKEEVFNLDNIDMQSAPAGLTIAEVRERTEAGLTNHTDITTEKTVGQII